MKALPRYQLRGAHVVAGCLVIVGVGAADIAQSTRLVLIPLFVLAPLVASIRATPQQTLYVGAAAILAAVGFGWVDDIWGSRRHTVAVATTVLGSLLAVWLAASRDARDRELAASVPVLRAVDRLKASLATGRIGEWSLNSVTDDVVWDANTAALFGLLDGEFNGTFDMYMRLIDERDRVMVQEAVDAAVESRQTFRFDHRCTWPDRSVHWVEIIGDVVVDEKTDQVVGAFGLVVDVDERHREIEERTRLLEFERRQRERVEYLASINEVLSRSVDTGEIVRTVTRTVIPEFADWCAIVVSIDRPRPRPLITVAHRDPDKVRWLNELRRQYPYNPDGRWGVAAVIRSGKPELIAQIDLRDLAAVDPDVLAKVDPASVITVPLLGALGTLGALQVIRGSNVPPYSNIDLELVEEIGGRVAAALNTAVLFQRQARGRAALETLQTVSGLIASVSTTDEIVRGALVEGGRGLGASSGSLYLVDNGALKVKEEVGLADHVRREAELSTAIRAIDDGQSVVRMVTTEDGDRFVAGAPMQIMSRVVGALAFTYDDQVEPTPEELSMLVTLGSRCAGALERASLYERERTVALTLQHRLLSRLPSTPEWIEAAASYVPATGLEIGGDWFQILETGDGRLVAVVGDAVGHGLQSAAAMGQLRASFITAVANDPDPLRALAAVDLFAGRGTDTVAASAAYILFDAAGTARYASAGHPPIVLVPSRGSPVIVDGGRGSLLGYRKTPAESVTVPFNKGDSIVMFTDGLIESRVDSFDDGLQRLVAAAQKARKLAPQQMNEHIIESMTTGRNPDDDIALLILRRA